jgi:hypothetical protein
MRPHRRRVLAAAVLMSGLALPPLSARPVQRPRHDVPAPSPVVAAWHEALSLLGLRVGDEPWRTSMQSRRAATDPSLSSLSAHDDTRAGLDPNG